MISRNIIVNRFFMFPENVNFRSASVSSYPAPLTEEVWRGRRVTEGSIVYRNSTVLPTAPTQGQ
jgi:hypothetical protein